MTDEKRLLSYKKQMQCINFESQMEEIKFSTKKFVEYQGHWNMEWILEDIAELIIFLSVTMILWLCRKMSLLLKYAC